MKNCQIFSVCQREKGPSFWRFGPIFPLLRWLVQRGRGKSTWASFPLPCQKDSSILFRLPSARNQKPSFWVHSEKIRLLEIMEECIRSPSTLSGPNFVPQDPPAWFSQYFKFDMEECEGTFRATLPDYEAPFWGIFFTFSWFSKLFKFDILSHGGMRGHFPGDSTRL